VATYGGKPIEHPSLDPPPGKIRTSLVYELLEAARWAGYAWETFDALDSDRQAQIVAHYRTSQRIQAVDTWANRPKIKPPKAKP
jgi:hypothetical protein